MSYASNATIDQLAARVAKATRVMITTHEKPDGDGFGSALALRRALTPGKVADVYVAGPIEPSLARIAGKTPYARVEHDTVGDDYDLVIVVDTGAWSQLTSLEPWLRARHELVIGLDHHPKGDDVASMRVVDTSQASAAQLVLKLLDALGCELTGGEGGVAEALFVGLATDTGWFRFGSADAEEFRVAARLLERGVDKSRLYQMIEEAYLPSRLALEGRALASLEYCYDGVVAIMSLRPTDFEETGGTVTDLTSLVNRPMQVERVRVAALLAETEPGRTKVSLRSKPAAPGRPKDDFVDVNQIAGRLGGGGHKHAAGARVDKAVDEAKRDVVGALEGCGEAER